MSENATYLKEKGLPRRLGFIEGCIGENINGGFRVLFEISKCYGEYAEAVAKELVKRYNPAPIFQLHWQFEDRTEMKSQCCPEETLVGNPNSTTEEEMQKWARDVQKRHPLPDEAKWLMCKEESIHFVWAAV